MTINLEKELIKQNARLATPKELLVIREFENNSELVENDALRKVGLSKNLEKGKELVNVKRAEKEETERFSQDRVFHITQIEKLCLKYHLRFLPSHQYIGTIDKHLATKITNTEAAYGINMGQYQKTYICAPRESFKLQEKPKDPLFFYKINDNYYYLVHKWGNDLSVWRSLMPFFSNTWVSWLIISFIFTLPLLLIHPAIYAGAGVIAAMGIGINNGMEDEDGKVRLVHKNYWNSNIRYV